MQRFSTPRAVDSCITIQNAVDRKYMKGEPYKPKKLCHTKKKKPWGLHPHPFPTHPRLITFDSHLSAWTPLRHVLDGENPPFLGGGS